jgi:hypothetical protein
MALLPYGLMAAVACWDNLVGMENWDDNIFCFVNLLIEICMMKIFVMCRFVQI